jgi:hypothetical protein
MNLFSLCFDNFLDDPDSIRLTGLELLKQSGMPDSEGRWPGIRTSIPKKLHLQIHTFIQKVYSVKFSHLSSQFQLSNPYFQNDKGWIHTDKNVDLAGVLYLNPDPDIDSGTSIFLPKENQNLQQGQKIKAYKNESVNEVEYINQLNSNWNNFEKTITFKNYYNRLICYPGSYYHALDKKVNNRLTIVFFASF